ncbi:hypothetical protein GOV04_05695 [Candidatus Woesearchaeota archaeon]|nr:hypothetical protein [Candidatus Woesearchaeota archaeon]
MKKQLITLIISMLLLFSTMVSAAVIDDEVPSFIPDTTSNVRIELLRAEPSPVEPGEYIMAYFKAENFATVKAKEVVFEFIENYPFSLDETTDPITEYGLVGALDLMTFDYKIRVDDNAVEGTNQIKIRVSTDGGITYKEQKFNVAVRTRDAIVSIEDIKTTPESLVPGETGAVKITLKNLADSLVRDIKFVMSFERVLGSGVTQTVTDLPFVPIGSSTEKNIKQMTPGQIISFDLNIMPFPDAAGGVYKIPVTLTYSDETGQTFTQNTIIGLPVNSMPDIITMIDSNTVVAGQNAGEVSLKFVNKGFTDIKFFTVEVMDNGAYEVVSPSRIVYIGDIDSDDFETADFNIFMTKNVKEVLLPVKIEYRDANNKLYTQNLEIPLKINDAAKLGNSSSKSGLIIFLLLAAGGGYWYYRRRKKKKSTK